MIIPDKIIRTHGHKLSLTINEHGQLIVRAPKHLPEKEIFKFIEEKEVWIVNKQDKINRVLTKNANLINYDEILYLGKTYSVVLVEGLSTPNLLDKDLVLPNKPAKKIVYIKKYFQSLASELLFKRVEYFAKLMKLDYSDLKIIDSIAKWGMCDNSKCIYLNWKLVMLPTDIIDYVIVHELSHILQMNHSPLFWEVVASIIPSYKKIRSILKSSNFLIRLY